MTPLVFRALERELLLWVRTWRGTIVSTFLQPFLYLGAMGLGLGGLIDERTADVDGVRYLQFVTPGLLVASAMLGVTGGALWGTMAGVKWMGQFRSMVHTAMTPGDVYGGLVLAAGVRVGVAAVVFLAAATVVGGVTSYWAPVAVLTAMLLASTTVACLAAYSATKETDDTFPLIMRLLVMPMFLFSGTFFPVEQLPDAIEPLAWLSPLFHAASAARMATTGAVTELFAVHVAVLLGIVAVAVPIGIRAFQERLTP